MALRTMPRRQASRVFVQGEEEICIRDVATLELRMGFLVDIHCDGEIMRNHCFLQDQSSMYTVLYMCCVKYGYVYDINDQWAIGMIPFVSDFG